MDRGRGKGVYGPILWGEADRGYFHASACLMGQYCAHCTDCLIQIYANAALARNSWAALRRGDKKSASPSIDGPSKGGSLCKHQKKGAKSPRTKYQIKGKIGFPCLASMTEIRNQLFKGGKITMHSILNFLLFCVSCNFLNFLHGISLGWPPPC